MNRDFRQRAFTLLEMLLAMTLLALILSMCYSVFSAAISTKERIERETERRKVSEAVFTLFRQTLAGAYFYGADSSPFELTRRLNRPHIHFRTFAPKEVDKAPTVHWVHYALEPHPLDPSRNILFVARTDSSKEDSRAFREVCDEVALFRVSVWDGHRWREEWREKEPPSLIQIELLPGKQGQSQDKPHRMVFSFYPLEASHVARAR